MYRKRILFFCYLFLYLSLQAQKTTFLIMRHGETDWNCTGKIQGQIDISLNEKGIQQAHEIAKCLAKKHPDITAIYSSDLSRGAMTANIIGKYLHILPRQEKALREVSQGEAEGLTWKEIKEKYHYIRKAEWSLLEISGGETYQNVISRMTLFLDKLEKEHTGKKILIVAHRLLIKTLSRKLCGPTHTIDLMNCDLLPMECTREEGQLLWQMLEKEKFCSG